MEVNGVEASDFKTAKKANELFDKLVIDVVENDDDDSEEEDDDDSEENELD